MLARGIKKLILIRLFMGSLFLYAPLILQEVSPVVFYTIPCAVCLLSVFYVLWYLTRRWLRLLAMIQIAGDVLLETYLVYFTGGTESLFVMFYILSILSACFVLGEKKAIFLITLFSGLTYFVSSFFSYRVPLSPLVFHDPVYFLYGTSIRIVIFFTVGYLSQRLSGKLVELQDQLKLSMRLSLLGEAASKIAHEVRNPLSSIRTAAEVLRDSLAGKLDPTAQKMMAILESESDRLTKTLQRILNYAKQVNPNPKMLLLDPLIERTISLISLNPQFQSNGVSVEKKYDANRTHLYADEEQIMSALLNLTLNAYQAMPQGGVLRISALEEMNKTRISIEDSGGGIPREKINDLFLPFKSSKKGGTGLGLAEVHKIVTLHEGKIEVESLSGRGTIFHLVFPKP